MKRVAWLPLFWLYPMGDRSCIRSATREEF